MTQYKMIRILSTAGSKETCLETSYSSKHMSSASFPIYSTIIPLKQQHMTPQTSSQKLTEIVDIIVKSRSQKSSLASKDNHKIKNKYFLPIKFINNFILIKYVNKKEVRVTSTYSFILVMPKPITGKRLISQFTSEQKLCLAFGEMMNTKELTILTHKIKCIYKFFMNQN